MDTTIAAAIVGGSVTIVVAVLGLISRVDRMRQLERIVALTREVDDAPGRERLLAIRDRLISRFEPTPADVRFLTIGGWSMGIGWALFLIGVVFLSLRGGSLEEGLRITGQVLLLIGAFLFAVGVASLALGVVEVIMNARAERKARVDAEAAAEAEAAASIVKRKRKSWRASS